MGCGARAPQPALRRHALAGARVVADPGRTMPGRGAYVCSEQCLEQAVRSRAFHRAFRRTVDADLDALRTALRSASQPH